MKLPLLAAMSLATIISNAVPAKRGLTLCVHQPDGSVVQLSLHGDENSHLYLTDDGISVIGTSDGYFYAMIDSDGHAACSSMLAHNPSDRTAIEATHILSIDQSDVHRAIRPGTHARRQITHSRLGSTAPGYPTIGKSVGLVFLVEYADIPFTISDPHSYFSDMLNRQGFSRYNATGSGRDYFIDNSHGLYDPTFDVYGPVTLPYPREYYGGNDTHGTDKSPHHMMLHAARALDDSVDFSRYDNDGDGLIDSVFIFYAGEGEAGGGGADTVWPHSWSYSFADMFDGVRFRDYACAPELISSWMPDGIGTFCHEFCHVLGLPDLYNTDDAYVNYTPLRWSVMDQGCYNNDSRTPAGMSAFERNALGWMDDFISEPDHQGVYSLLALTDGGDALLLPTEQPQEFFILENRQQTSWDTYLPYHGMLVWHIDYDNALWRNNTANNQERHQHVDIVEACGKTYANTTGQKRYTFPGVNDVTSLTYGGTPSLQDWLGNDLGYTLTDIKECDGVITFELSGESGIPDICIPEKSWYLDGNTLHGHGGNVTLTDISGCTIASGAEIEIQLAAPGLYIISVDGNASKVIIR